MWVLIYRCLDQTAALFLPFQYSYGLCTAALKMYWNGLHLHLQLRWRAVSSTGLSSFKVVNGIPPCPFIRTKNLVVKLTPMGCFLIQDQKKSHKQILCCNGPEECYRNDKILTILLLNERTLIHHWLFYQLPFPPHIKTDKYGSFLNMFFLSPDSNLMAITGTCCWQCKAPSWSRKKPKRATNVNIFSLSSDPVGIV